MKTFNQVILLGYVCRPEYAGDNKPLRFAVATERAGYTRADGTVVPKEPQFWNCVCFGKLATTISQFLQQGDAVLVEGELSSNSYTDKNGVDRVSTNIIANNIHIIHHKQDVNTQPRNNQQQFANQMPQPGAMPQYQQQPYQPQYQQQQYQQQQYQQQQYQPPVQGKNPPF